MFGRKQQADVAETNQQHTSAQVISHFQEGRLKYASALQGGFAVQSFYKPIAALIKSRLAKVFNGWIYVTQYGFRDNRGSSHATSWHMCCRTLLKKKEATLLSFYWTGPKHSTKSTRTSIRHFVQNSCRQQTPVLD